MDINKLMTSKPAEEYADLTNGGIFSVDLNQHEACVALKIHDYGIDALTESEKDNLHTLIGKLKDQIWP